MTFLGDYHVLLLGFQLFKIHAPSGLHLVVPYDSQFTLLH